MRVTNKITGFTLIEIIVALFVFSIVSLIVVGALHTVLSTQSAVEKKAERVAKLQVALLFLSRDFEQTINRPITNPSGSEEGFIGTHNTVSFTHAGLQNPLGQLQRATLQRTRYQLNNHTLSRLTWPMLDQSEDTKPDARALLDSVDDLQFDYLDSQGHFQKIWPPLAQQKEALPLAIRISFTIQNWGNITELYLIPGSST